MQEAHDLVLRRFAPYVRNRYSSRVTACKVTRTKAFTDTHTLIAHLISGDFSRGMTLVCLCSPDWTLYSMIQTTFCTLVLLPIRVLCLGIMLILVYVSADSQSLPDFSCSIEMVVCALNMGELRIKYGPTHIISFVFTFSAPGPGCCIPVLGETSYCKTSPGTGTVMRLAQSEAYHQIDPCTCIGVDFPLLLANIITDQTPATLPSFASGCACTTFVQEWCI